MKRNSIEYALSHLLKVNEKIRDLKRRFTTSRREKWEVAQTKSERGVLGSRQTIFQNRFSKWKPRDSMRYFTACTTHTSYRKRSTIIKGHSMVWSLHIYSESKTRTQTWMLICRSNFGLPSPPGIIRISLLSQSKTTTSSTPQSWRTLFWHSTVVHHQ